jgi:hypothetical protein
MKKRIQVWLHDLKGVRRCLYEGGSLLASDKVAETAARALCMFGQSFGIRIVFVTNMGREDNTVSEKLWHDGICIAYSKNERKSLFKLALDR